MTSPRTSRTAKARLRAAVLPLLNSGVPEAKIREFIDLVNEIRPSLSSVQVDNTFKAIEHCDVACAFAPGHQSTVVCTVRGDSHTHHYNRTHRLEWDETDISEQTHTINGKTYRLAFSDKGWF